MKEANHGARAHAKFAPSASDKWLKCFGYVSMLAKAPPEKVNPAALEGTRAHECLEFIAKYAPNNTEARVREWALKKWPEVMVNHGYRSWRVIQKLQPGERAKLYIEQKVKLTEEVYGSLDYAWVDTWGTLIIKDYKYGLHLVLPKDQDTGEENTQLMCYAAAMAKRFHYEFDTVKLAIIQPRAWDESEEPVVIANTTVRRLQAFEERVKNAVAEAKKPNPKLVYGEEHCRWCRAKTICPAFLAGQNDPYSLVFDTLPETKT